MALNLYNITHSYFSIIARIALAEISIPYTPVLVNILNKSHPAQFEEDYIRLNPAGTVPSLVGSIVVPGEAQPREIALTESRDIVEWCFSLPTAPRLPDQVRDASDIVMERFYGGNWDYIFGVGLAAPDKEREALVAKWRDRETAAITKIEETERKIAAGAGVSDLEELLERYRRKKDQNAERIALYLPSLPPNPTAEFPFGLDRAKLLCSEFEADLKAAESLANELQPGVCEFWFAGPVFCPADVVIAALLTRFRVYGYEGVLFGPGTSGYPYLTNYWARLKARRSYINAVTDFKMDT
ncbi:hypothetical protein M427DRAFT_160855 [Gonapodya prolifera JEL478]|uniref:GST N-terminal domain-containing protein n=1 Tax=Gonapodya prolifera (strain JEL478) TaxID=1344416 RepID=A0A138ZXL8_GONPJ|nr:hypothetical protein M427DRAFT_160855 [Gonapodya prolifera JEL478]|eukprot:KXS09237.1 hypothetical protein M427DRAFT_160855 [Gonapodya prolifera JEL478]